MTNEELLKIYSQYLPYGLNCKFDFPLDENINSVQMTLLGIEKSFEEDIWVGLFGEFGEIELNKFKPILRPLSDLTKEIEHKGERFVPMEKLAETFSMNTVEYNFIRENIGNFDFIIFNSLRYIVAQKLLEYHFDIFGLLDKNLAINKNDLK